MPLSENILICFSCVNSSLLITLIIYNILLNHDLLIKWEWSYDFIINTIN